jgi:NCS1 family nucleobase:cation symporter-1
MIAGVGTYLYLLNPQSYVIREPFSFIGASLPAAVAAALVYGLVTVLLVRRSGRGGYSSQGETSGQVSTPTVARSQS